MINENILSLKRKCALILIQGSVVFKPTAAHDTDKWRYCQWNWSHSNLLVLVMTPRVFGTTVKTTLVCISKIRCSSLSIEAHINMGMVPNTYKATLILNNYLYLESLLNRLSSARLKEPRIRDEGYIPIWSIFRE